MLPASNSHHHEQSGQSPASKHYTLIPLSIFYLPSSFKPSSREPSPRVNSIVPLKPSMRGVPIGSRRRSEIGEWLPMQLELERERHPSPWLGPLRYDMVRVAGEYRRCNNL